MQRLIDADAYEHAVQGNPYVSDSMKTYVRCSIQSQPTIDAIPIEFIQKRIDQLKEMNGLIFEYEQWELERLVRKWREENATAD